MFNSAFWADLQSCRKVLSKMFWFWCCFISRARQFQTHVQRYTKPLLDRIRAGEVDPSFVITHRVNLEEAPVAYKKFRDKEDGCIKVVLKPQLDDSVKTTTINGN